MNKRRTLEKSIVVAPRNSAKIANKTTATTIRRYVNYIDFKQFKAQNYETTIFYDRYIYTKIEI